MPQSQRIVFGLLIIVVALFFDKDFKDQPIEWLGLVVIVLLVIFHDRVQTSLGQKPDDKDQDVDKNKD